MSSSKNWPIKGLCDRCLSEFIDWRYSQSCWYFPFSFVNFCHSNLLSGSTLPPPLPCVNNYTVYTSIVYGGVGFWASDTCFKVSLQFNFLKMTTFCIAFYESYLSTQDAFHKWRILLGGGGGGGGILPPVCLQAPDPVSCIETMQIWEIFDTSCLTAWSCYRHAVRCMQRTAATQLRAQHWVARQFTTF